MALSTQSNFDKIANADAHAQGIDGGLNLKTDASRLAPPATTRADNGWYESPGNVQQLPAPQVAYNGAAHIYNMHARDLQTPSVAGDLLLHAESRDGGGSPFTSPVWWDGNGATVNNAQPMPPWQMRTRVMSGQFPIADSGAAQFNMMTVTEQQVALPQGRRYGIMYHNGTQLLGTFGLCDGSIETLATIAYSAPGQYCELLAHQGASQWSAFVQNGTTITRYTFGFDGVFVSSSIITSNALSSTVTPGVVSNSLSVFQHAARSYCAYLTPAVGSNFTMSLYDCVSGATLTTSLSVPNSVNMGFACFSSTTHQASPGTSYFGVVIANGVRVYATTGLVPTTLTQVTAQRQLNFAVNSGASSSEGVVSYLTTGAAFVTDTQHGFTVFRTYPEQQTGDVPYGSCWYQNVSVDALVFTPNATDPLGIGTLASVSQNVFRTASGVALASKAWSAAPSEVNFAGPANAKSAYCVVRAGAWEPYNGSPPYSSATYQAQCLYGQPTYFVLDHQARVVARAFEAQGPIDAVNNSLAAKQPSGNPPSQARTTNWANAVLPTGLGSPILQAPNSDTSVLDITMPLWVQTDQKAVRFINYNGIAWYAVPPSAAVNQPCALNFTVNAQGAQCPVVQAGPYSVLSGPLTCLHDGRGVVEANYHFQAHNPLPIMTTQSGTASAGTVFPPGVYYYIAVYEWYDSLGRVHRSTPSLPVGVPVYSGTVGTSCTVQVPIPPSVKPIVGGALYVRLYRSLVNGNAGTFYLVNTGRAGVPVRNGMCATPIVDALYCDTSTAPAAGYSISTQPRLYTNLASDTATVFTYASTPPPAFVWQASSRGRSFGLCQTFGQHRLYYTSVAQDRFPFEWNTFNYAPVPPEIGDVRSIETIDDKVLIFGTRQNAYLSGNGPASAGPSTVPSPGDGYDSIMPIPTPQGVIGTGGPVRGPDGIYFQGFSGLQLAGRDLTTTPVGAAVDTITGRQYNNPGQVFGRGAVLPSLQSMVWPCATGPALVYNYLTQKWSTWPLLSNATLLAQRLDGSLFAILQPILNSKYAGPATQSSAGCELVTLSSTYAPTFRGLDTSPGLVIETPWILPSGESGGEAQLWDVTCTGSWLGPHVLQVEQAYNYNAAYSISTRFNFPTKPVLYQARVRPSTSRVWAVRYRLSVLPLSTLSSGYQMAALSDLVVNFGAKQGTTRLGASLSG